MRVETSPRWGVPAVPSPPAASRSTAEDAVGGAERVDAAEVQLRRARIADMRAVASLIHTFAEHNQMLPRSIDQLARNFREFVVAVDGEDRVVACGALRVYTEDLAEICSLAVDQPLQGAGIGGRLVGRLVEDARELGVGKVFALTLRPDFFGRLGFSEVPREEFPLKVWADCRSCPKLHACDEIAMALRVGGSS